MSGIDDIREVQNDAEITANLAEAGYAIVRGALSVVAADRIRNESATAFMADPMLDPHSIHPPGTDLYATANERGRRSERVLGHLLPLVLNPRVCSIVRGIVADEPMILTGLEPFRTSPSIRSPRAGEPGRDPARNAHVHNFSYFEPMRGSVMGWFALEDIRRDAGPMWIEPGSHVRNRHLFDDVIADDPRLGKDIAALRATGAGYADWGGWMLRMQSVMTELLERGIDDRAGVRMPVLLSAGDLLVFDNALTHGTMMPDDRTATRWSLLARFQGRSTREYGWPSWLEAEPYELAIRTLPHVPYQAVRCGDGWLATNFDQVYDAMFWSSPLAQEAIE